MRTFFYLLVVFIVSSCYYDYDLFGELEAVKRQSGAYSWQYVTYEDNRLEPYNECQVSMSLINLFDREFISKNETAIIEDSTAKIEVYIRDGVYRRNLHLLILPDIDIMVTDTIIVE